MFYSPFYRGGYGYPSYPYYGGGYGGFGGFGGSSFALNSFGSQIGNQSLINTGTMSGVNQTFSPTMIW